MKAQKCALSFFFSAMSVVVLCENAFMEGSRLSPHGGLKMMMNDNEQPYTQPLALRWFHPLHDTN